MAFDPLAKLDQPRFWQAYDPFWRYCLLATLLACVPSWLVDFFGPPLLAKMGVASVPLAEQVGVLTPFMLLAIVLLIPVGESLVLAWTATVASSANASRSVVSICSGICWGLLHAGSGWLACITAMWSFSVMTGVFLVWRERSSGLGYLSALIPHVVNNATLMLVVQLSRP